MIAKINLSNYIKDTDDLMYIFKYIESPSEELQLVAVNQKGCAIKHIKNPYEGFLITML